MPGMKTLKNTVLTLTVLAALSACGRNDSDDAAVSVGEALLQVAEQGDLGALNRLLGKQVQPDARDSCDWTPLMKAALNGHEPVVDRLIEAGAEIDAFDKGGYTAMMLAASNNYAKVVDLLLKHGAAVDHQEATAGWTALIWAAKQGHSRTVQTLLAHKADTTLKDSTGMTAADWARQGEFAETLALLDAAH